MVSGTAFRIIDFGQAVIVQEGSKVATLKLAEIVDLFFGESRHAYDLPLPFRSKEEWKEAWLYVTQTFAPRDLLLKQAFELVTRGFQNDFAAHPEFLVRLRESPDVVYAALLKGADINRRETYYYVLLKNMIPQQARLQFVNHYTIHATSFVHPNSLVKILFPVLEGPPFWLNRQYLEGWYGIVAS
jgi:hypothetical protein